MIPWLFQRPTWHLDEDDMPCAVHPAPPKPPAPDVCAYSVCGKEIFPEQFWCSDQHHVSWLAEWRGEVA